MKTKAFIYIIVAGILWGTSGIFVHLLSPYGFSTFQMTAVRGLISFIGMLVYAYLSDKALFRCKAKDFIFFIPIGATLFGTAALYYASMTMTSVSTAVVLMYMAPVYVMIFSVLFLGESFSSLKAVSVAAMLIGCCLVSGIIGGITFNFIGILLGVLAGFSYATYNVVTKIALKNNINTVTATLYSFMIMAIIALSVSKPHMIVVKAAENPLATIPLLIGLGVVTFVIPYFLYTLAMRDLPAGTAAALGIVEPMAATVFSIMFLGEKLSWLPALGIILILLAVFALGKAEGNDDNNKESEQTKEKEHELH
ncbi:MAG: EamA family transporter [Clostridia bacterium]|nr:EamA family transporter [Clostridia bacterium]